MTLYQLFKNPETWLKNELARTKSGREVWPNELRRKECVAWCLVGGAIQVTKTRKEQDSLLKKLSDRIKIMFPMRIRSDIPWDIVVGFNNNYKTTFQDIKKVIKGVRT